MCDTADFPCYPPVITANQILMLPTGNYRYRGGSVCTSYPSPGVPSVVRLLFAFVTSAALSTTPQLHGGMTFVCMYDTLHPPPRTAAAAVVWYRAQSAQRTDCTKKKNTNMLHSSLCTKGMMSIMYQGYEGAP